MALGHERYKIHLKIAIERLNVKNMRCRHYLISGKVQGVSFRFYTHEKARGLNLRGWVRNLEDGRVEAVAEGDDESLAEFERWLQKGPPAAQVKDVLASDTDKRIESTAFFIRRDGGPTWP